MGNLQRIRKEKKVTQAALAEQSGVNLRTLQDYEQGRININNASGESLFKMACVLGCHIEDILEGIEDIMKELEEEYNA